MTAAILLGALSLAPAAGAQAPAIATVPAGVTVAGVDLGGLDAAAASTKLEAARSFLQRDTVLRFGKRQHRLSAGQALYSINVPESVAAALASSPNRSLDPVVSYSKDNVRAFVKKVAKREYLAPRDARIAIKPDRIQVAPHRVGRRLLVNPVAAEIERSLKSPASPRNLTPKRKAVKAKETKGSLKKKYRTVLTANRGTFKLRLFKDLKLRKTYDIAVGAAGHDTPGGLYTISNKAVNPAWHVPNSAWAGSLAGSVIPGGAPNNPLKARWLGIVDGVGIHGTAEEWSIGTRASKGCLRMRVKDVVDLYPRVPVGTTVLIK